MFTPKTWTVFFVLTLSVAYHNPETTRNVLIIPKKIKETNLVFTQSPPY